MSLMSTPLDPRLRGVAAKAGPGAPPPPATPVPPAPIPARALTEQDLIDLFGLEVSSASAQETHTLIHARLKAIADTSQSSASAVSSLVDATDRQSTALSGALNNSKLDLAPLALGLGGIAQTIGTAGQSAIDLQPLTLAINGISQKLQEQQTALLDTIRTSIGGLAGSFDGAPVVLDEARKECLRAINRAEQLILDREPENKPAEKARKNNSDLEKLRDSALGKAAEAAFTSLNQLDAWKNLSKDFEPLQNADAERPGRLALCHQLRRAVLFGSRP